MSYDESRALLGEPERPRRPMPILAIVLGAACFAGVGVAAGVVFAAKRAESEAVGARVAAPSNRAQSLAEHTNTTRIHSQERAPGQVTLAGACLLR
jgi:ribosomal protein S12 methylthiotransferase accessory factor YcaO